MWFSDAGDCYEPCDRRLHRQRKRAARLVLLGVSTAAASLGMRAIYLGLAARRVALDTSAGAHARAVIIH
jgi:hypothetical protein